MEQCYRNNVILMLGSNTGDRKTNLDKAVEALRRYVDIETVTCDIDNPDFTGRGPDYLNRLLCINTNLSLDVLKSVSQKIELDLGRDTSKFPFINIDVDIIIFNGTIIKTSEFNSYPYQLLIKTLYKEQ